MEKEKGGGKKQIYSCVLERETLDFKQRVPTSLTHGNPKTLQSLPGGSSTETVDMLLGQYLPKPCAATPRLSGDRMGAPETQVKGEEESWSGSGISGLLLALPCLGRRTVGGLQTSQKSF